MQLRSKQETGTNKINHTATPNIQDRTAPTVDLRHDRGSRVTFPGGQSFRHGSSGGNERWSVLIHIAGQRQFGKLPMMRNAGIGGNYETDGEPPIAILPPLDDMSRAIVRNTKLNHPRTLQVCHGHQDLPLDHGPSLQQPRHVPGDHATIDGSSDGRLIRPLDEPVMAPVAFDWNTVAGEALATRAELRAQRWRVRQQYLICQASQNFLKPTVDLVGRYRWRGFGDDLLNSNRGNKPAFDNAFNTLTGGDFQEWQLGVEWSAPIGYRRAHTGVRYAQLSLARERAVLREQERQIVHDLSGIVAEKDRAMAIVGTSFNRRVAAYEQVAAVQAAYDADQAPLDLVLEAQRRLADAESRYHRSRIEYMIAIRNVHFEKGSLLDFRQVYLAEGPWPQKAYHDAGQRERLRGKPHNLDYRMTTR